MKKEEFRLLEKEYNVWIDQHPKKGHSYVSWSHMKRTLEFAKYYNEKQLQVNTSPIKAKVINIDTNIGDIYL